MKEYRCTWTSYKNGKAGSFFIKAENRKDAWNEINKRLESITGLVGVKSYDKKTIRISIREEK